MTHEPSRKDMEQLWQGQEVEAMRIPVEEIRRKAMAFQIKITMRNVREYLAGIVVIMAFTYLFITVNEVWARISFGLVIAATFYVAWNLLTRGAPSAVPSDLGQSAYLDFHRHELERQRDLLRDVWRWYLGPFVPGVALLTGLSLSNAPGTRRWFVAGFTVLTAVLFWWIGRMNSRAAGRIDRRIQEIKSLQDDDI
jgi:hypothetical protein